MEFNQANKCGAAFESIFPLEREIPERLRITEPLDGSCYLLNGEICRWLGPVREVFSPVCLRRPAAEGVLATTEGATAATAGASAEPKAKLIGYYPLCTEKVALAALDAASRAYDNGRGLWPTLPIAERIKHFERFIGKMVAQREAVVKLLMWEIGKSQVDSEREFDRTVEYIRDTITALKELDRRSARFTIDQGVIAQIRRSPLGVVLCMGPYNYPLNETFTTLIPALIMGNTVVFKPPKLGVLLHLPLLEAFRDSFPPGVVNTVYGDGATVITPLMQSGRIDVLAFIGTSPVADVLKKHHPKPHRLRCVLGLEAKNPAIILPDADLDLAVQECLLGSLAYNGQRCTAIKIIFVHADIAPAFVSKFAAAVDQLKVGLPWEDGVKITPLPEAHKPAYLKSLVEDAQTKGARVVNPAGGKIDATFFYPAVLYPVNEQMAVYHEEQFGPVVPIGIFEDIQAPINYIINSKYGQQVSIFGSDPRILSSIIDPLVNQVTRVNLNSQCQRGPDSFPFNGRKDSGEGTLSVADALRVFSIRTLVAAKAETLNKQILRQILNERTSNFLSTDFIF